MLTQYTDEMSPEAQRIAISEACGLSCESCKMALEHFHDTYGYPDAIFLLAKIPDYLHDLNAMHEAEKVLNDSQRFDYELCLEAIQVRQGKHYSDAVFSTSVERAEAFLRTIGKWNTTGNGAG